MSLNRRQLHRLHRIESGLLRSDPQLAAKLAVFGHLSVGQGLPSWEQIATRRDRVRQAAALIVKAVTLLVTAIILLLSAIRGLARAVVLGPRARPAAEGAPADDRQGWNPAQGS
jgi:hypothetical protein